MEHIYIFNHQIPKHPNNPNPSNHNYNYSIRIFPNPMQLQRQHLLQHGQQNQTNMPFKGPPNNKTNT